MSFQYTVCNTVYEGRRGEGVVSKGVVKWSEGETCVCNNGLSDVAYVHSLEVLMSWLRNVGVWCQGAADKLTGGAQASLPHTNCVLVLYPQH